jgi:hypothetical protein
LRAKAMSNVRRSSRVQTTKKASLSETPQGAVPRMLCAGDGERGP